MIPFVHRNQRWIAPLNELGNESFLVPSNTVEGESQQSLTFSDFQEDELQTLKVIVLW